MSSRSNLRNTTHPIPSHQCQARPSRYVHQRQHRTLFPWACPIAKYLIHVHACTSTDSRVQPKVNAKSFAIHGLARRVIKQLFIYRGASCVGICALIRLGRILRALGNYTVYATSSPHHTFTGSQHHHNYATTRSHFFTKAHKAWKVKEKKSWYFCHSAAWQCHRPMHKASCRMLLAHVPHVPCPCAISSSGEQGPCVKGASLQQP